MSRPSAAFWKKHLDLIEHVEGGAYSEVYRSPLLISKNELSPLFDGDRPISTHIYFLLEQDQFSAFHRIRSDEIWHFYNGDPVIVYEIQQDGKLIKHLLGDNPIAGESFSCVIKAGNWFGSRPVSGGEYGLVGCTVTPGFDFADFELAIKEQLAAEFPQHTALINELCR